MGTRIINIAFFIFENFSTYTEATYPHKDRHSRPSSIALQSKNTFEMCNGYKNLPMVT